MKRGNIKSTIEYIVRLLNRVGITCLSPEILRQAKFDSKEVTPKLWRAVHDLTLLILADFPQDNSADRVEDLWSVLEHEGYPEGCPASVYFVKHHLALWGYPDKAFYRLSTDGSGSRALLLALGWLLSRFRVFTIAQLRDADPRGRRDAEPSSASTAAQAAGEAGGYPGDTGRRRGAGEAGARGAREARQVLQAAAATAAAVPPEDRAHTRAHHALLLRGRLQAAAQQVGALARCQQKQSHGLLEAQLEMHWKNNPNVFKAQSPHIPLAPGTAAFIPRVARPSKGPTGEDVTGRAPEPKKVIGVEVVTGYEAYLLRNPSAMEEQQASLQALRSLDREREAGRHHVHTFFQWLTSVVAEHRKEAGGAAPSGGAEGGEAVHDPSATHALSSKELVELAHCLDQELSADMAACWPDIAALADCWAQVNVARLPPEEQQQMEAELASAEHTRLMLGSLRDLQQAATRAVDAGHSPGTLKEEDSKLPEDIEALLAGSRSGSGDVRESGPVQGAPMAKAGASEHDRQNGESSATEGASCSVSYTYVGGNGAGYPASASAKGVCEVHAEDVVQWLSEVAATGTRQVERLRADCVQAMHRVLQPYQDGKHLIMGLPQA